MATANQQWKQYKKEGGQLGFSEWIDREKRKNFMNATGELPDNKPLNDSIQGTLDKMHRQEGFQDDLTSQYIFGIKKNYLIGAGLFLLVGGVALIVYKKQKQA
jgi:hypothetical protein